MHLKKLEIQGFKSFAKKTHLEFEPGITSVVGPNGSGKSNIADSLRWVFGEQSMKLLRGKKSEDIIFAGSDQKARLGGTEVTVTFENSDRKIPLDYSEVMISRRLYREGNSDYLINGNEVRLLDIQDLLAKSGFGNTSYHVIGQGMIDHLILGGPVAVKELVEEAAGIKPYYVKRDRALRRMEHTETNLEQVRALVTEIEPRLRSLRRQAKRLERREEVETELRVKQKVYFANLLAQHRRELSGVEEKLKSFVSHEGKLNDEIKKLSQEIDEHEKKVSSGSEDFKKLKSDLEILQKQRFNVQEELATIRGRLKAEQRVPVPQISIDLLGLSERFDVLYERLEELVKNFDATKVSEIVSGFAEIKSTLSSASRDLKNKQQTHELQTQVEKLERDLQKLLEQIVSVEKDLAVYSDTEDRAKQQLFVKERLLRTKQEAVVKSLEQKNQLSIEQARFQERIKNTEEEASLALGQNFTKEMEGAADKTASMQELSQTIQKLKKQLEMIGGVDEMMQQEYRETEDRFQYLTTQSGDLEKGIADLRAVIAELDGVIKTEFDSAFEKISTKFVEYFKILFGGGRATMTRLRERPRPKDVILEEDESPTIGSGDPIATFPASPAGRQNDKDLKPEITGIEIRATPPGKKLAGIAALSGGERALTSIAFLCAMLATYPSPFVVLDEVDAALDEANSIRFGKILGTLAHKTQFITITHNRETMRQSHTLYGVTMGDDGVSKVLSLKLEQAAVYSTKN